MNTATHPALTPGRQDLHALNRAVAWSVTLHVVAVAFFIVAPRDWFSERPKPTITITLGGTPGPSSTGMTSIGGRTVEQPAPPPKRPEPVRPTPKPPPGPVVVTAPIQTRPSTTAKRADAAARPPTTGPQVTQGNTPVDTGARGQGTGLTFGGGGTGGEMRIMEFCCPEYVQLLTSWIDQTWQKNQPEHGTTELRFTITRAGVISDIQIVESSGSSVLDRVSRAAIRDLPALPLPPKYPNATLTVRIRFPYEGS